MPNYEKTRAYKWIATQFCEVEGGTVYTEKALKQAILDLKPSFWCFILHDSDLTDEGEPKKAHWHIVLEFANQRSFSVVKSGLFETSHIEPASDIKRCVQYLTHKNDEEKHQYAPELIIASDKVRCDRLLYAREFVDDTEELTVDILENGFCLRDCLTKYSFEFVAKYRPLINDLIREREGMNRWEFAVRSAKERIANARCSLSELKTYLDLGLISAEEFERAIHTADLKTGKLPF